MKAVFGNLSAITVLGVLVLAPTVIAQSVRPGGMTKTIEGRVLVIDPLGKVITLEDGTKLMIPESVKIRRADFKPGTPVKAAYEDRDGQKVLTKLEVAK
jgi:Protein of unknown function (DUF1344)